MFGGMILKNGILTLNTHLNDNRVDNRPFKNVRLGCFLGTRLKILSAFGKIVLERFKKVILFESRHNLIIIVNLNIGGRCTRQPFRTFSVKCHLNSPYTVWEDTGFQNTQSVCQVHQNALCQYNTKCGLCIERTTIFKTKLPRSGDHGPARSTKSGMISCMFELPDLRKHFEISLITELRERVGLDSSSDGTAGLMRMAARLKTALLRKGRELRKTSR